VVGGSVVGTYDLPFLPQKPVLNRYPTLVLGENGTAFATDGMDPDNGPQVVSLNVSTGAVNWSYQAGTGSALSIVAATTGGGLAVNNSQAGVTQLDGNGSPSPITGTAGGIAQTAVDGSWYLQSAQAPSKLFVPPLVLAQSFWAFPNGSQSPNGGAVDQVQTVETRVLLSNCRQTVRRSERTTIRSKS
jgi:hypothetical protein